MIVYGIPNCNTVKKGRTWLSENGFTSEFHDFKKKGITAEKLREWCNIFGWEKVLNKKGTTWKNLTAEERESVTDQESAIQILLKHTSAIKRPIVEVGGKAVVIGFDESDYNKTLR
jgi:arsenate reductase